MTVKCPRCGASASSDQERCFNCRAELNARPSSSPAGRLLLVGGLAAGALFLAYRAGQASREGMPCVPAPEAAVASTTGVAAPPEEAPAPEPALNSAPEPVAEPAPAPVPEPASVKEGPATPPRPASVVPRVQTVAVAPEKARTKSAAFELHARKEMPRGAVYLFGEYANTGEVELGKPSVTVVFVAKDGKELGQGKGYAEVPSLPPGGRTPMSIFLKDPPAGCELRFVADAGWLDSRRQAAGLRVDAHPAARSFAMWKASGRVLNEGGSPAHWVGVVAVGRSAAGKVVGLGHAMAVLGDPLAPGGESRWEVPFLVAAEEPATFEYFAHGFVP